MKAWSHKGLMAQNYIQDLNPTKSYKKMDGQDVGFIWLVTILFLIHFYSFFVTFLNISGSLGRSTRMKRNE